MAGDGPGYTWTADNPAARAEIEARAGQPNHRRRVDYVFVGSPGRAPGRPLTLLASTLTDVAVELAQSLARQGFKVIVLLSAHGGNAAALDAAVAQLEAAADGAVVCAPRGDVGPRPGSHSGAWLTSVMLALRAHLVEAERVSGDLAEEVRAADARQGLDNLERFVDSIVHAVRAATAPSG